MADVNSLEDSVLSITDDHNFEGEISLVDFLKNMPQELEILHDARDVFQRTILAICCQRKSHENIFGSNKAFSDVKHRIQCSLIEIRNKLALFLPYLVQLWAPVTIDGRRFLVTSELPFGIFNFVDRRPCSYRKHCLSYRYSVDCEDGDGGLSALSRVFLKETAESNYITNYSIKEYPLRGHAVTCQGEEIRFVPVYEPQGGVCIGVFEFVSFLYRQTSPDESFRDMSTLFQSSNLRLKEWPSLFTGYHDALDEFDKTLGHLCEKQYIPLVQLWETRRARNIIGHSVIKRKWNNKNRKNFSQLQIRECERRQFKQCVVGEAFSSFSSCFRGNITRLSNGVVVEALDHVGSTGDVVSNFAVCLRHAKSGYRTFILEFYFTSYKYPLKLVRSILDTIKHEFPNLRLASGQELGKVNIQILSPLLNDAVDVPRGGITLSKVPPEIEVPQNRRELCLSSLELLAEVVVSPHDSSESEIMPLDKPLGANGHTIGGPQKHIDLVEAETMLLDQHSMTNTHTTDIMQKGVGPNEAEMMPSDKHLVINAYVDIMQNIMDPSEEEATRTVENAHNVDIILVESESNEGGMMVLDQPSVVNSLNVDIQQKDIDPSEPEMMSSNQLSVVTSHHTDRLPKDTNKKEFEIMQADQLSIESASCMEPGKRPWIDIEDNAKLGSGQIINEGRMEERITREVLEQHAVGNLEAVIRHLQVGKTTFQTICRNHGIRNWRSFWKTRARKMDQDSLKAAQKHIEESYCRTEYQGVPQIKDNISSASETTVQSIPKRPRIRKDNNVTVKASFESKKIAFELSPFTAKITDLGEMIANRFKLQANSFNMKYEDEDKDLILLAIDKDLSYCFSKVELFRNKVVYVTIEKI